MEHGGRKTGGFAPLPVETEKIATEIVDAAFQVHKFWGPGMLEGTYAGSMVKEFEIRKIPCRSEVVFPVKYKGMDIEKGFRFDLLVGERVIVEVKAVQEMHPLFEAQILSYMTAGGFRLGFLINFNVLLIRDGIKRFVL